MAAKSSLSGLRILIAEDEAVIALNLETLIVSFGCDVVGLAARPSDVLKLIDNERVDGALLDVNLRGEQIFSVLPEILKRNIPVIITSGYADMTLYPPEYRELPRITKPFTPSALEDLCKRIFG